MDRQNLILNEEQRVRLIELWFVFGNRGPKHTHANHRFIQCILEHGEYLEDFFQPTSECRDAVLEVLASEQDSE